MPLIALHCWSAFFQFLAAGFSVAFVWKRRLGKVWLLVFLALLLKGLLSLGMATMVSTTEHPRLDDTQVPVAELFISMLLAGGFALTGQWFRMKERLEARFDLIAEVDRSLVGLLEEGRILSTVCDVLTRRNGYGAAWVGVAEPDGSIRAERTAGPAAGLIGEISFRWDDAEQQEWATVSPGQVTYFTYRGKDGFRVGPPLTPEPDFLPTLVAE